MNELGPHTTTTTCANQKEEVAAVSVMGQELS